MTRLTRLVLLAVAVAATLYGGGKGGRRGSVTYPRTDPTAAYLVDAGSFVTNDLVHVDFTRVIVPDSASLYIDRRPVSSTNDADWVTHLSTTFAEFPVPHDIHFAAATNWNWIVYTDWTPGPTVVTNGVWHAVWGRDRRGGSYLIPVRTSVRVDNDVIAAPSSRPYDARVEWLESTGMADMRVMPTTYVDTEVVGSSPLVVKIDFCWMQKGKTSMLFGSRNGVNGRMQACLDDNGVYYSYGFAEKLHPSNVLPTLGVMQHAEYVYDVDYGWSLNGSVVVRGTHAQYNNGRSIWLFASNTTTDALGGNCAKRIYRCDFIKSGELVRSFVPVRFTNERGEAEGAMYDRVSGRLFRNKGTGRFVIGPDK